MENTELQKLANCITFSGNRGNEEFKQDLTEFIQQVKAKTDGTFNGVSKVLLLQGKEGVGKTTLTQKLTAIGSHESLQFGDTKATNWALASVQILEISEISLGISSQLKIVELSAYTTVTVRNPYEREASSHPVTASIICTTEDTTELEEGGVIKPFIIEEIDFEAINAIDFQKIYQSI